MPYSICFSPLVKLILFIYLGNWESNSGPHYATELYPWRQNWFFTRFMLKELNSLNHGGHWVRKSWAIYCFWGTCRVGLLLALSHIFVSHLTQPFFMFVLIWRYPVKYILLIQQHQTRNRHSGIISVPEWHVSDIGIFSVRHTVSVLPLLMHINHAEDRLSCDIFIAICENETILQHRAWESF